MLHCGKDREPDEDKMQWQPEVSDIFSLCVCVCMSVSPLPNPARSDTLFNVFASTVGVYAYLKEQQLLFDIIIILLPLNSIRAAAVETVLNIPLLQLQKPSVQFYVSRPESKN